jgi:hypothetical protein
MKSRVLILLFSFFCGHCFAQSEAGSFNYVWCHYQGTIGITAMRASLYFFDDNEVRGNYYADCGKKIQLEGK